MKILKALGFAVAVVVVVVALWIEMNYDGGVKAFVDDLISQEGPQINKLEQNFELDIDT